jgi:hypothetical protein
LRIHVCSVAAVAILLANPLYSQETEEALDDARDFDLPASEMADMVGDGGLDLGDVDFKGSPLKRFAGKWPEDLVVAPIPGRSPQLGWQLTLGAGYFLGAKDVDSDTPPSILGGFGMASENGSYAYGGGAYLHLLDDDLRIKAGAAYADINYEFFGVGNDINRLDISVQIRQKMPLFFGTAAYRVWKKLYLGLGYTGGTVDTAAKIDIEIPDPQLVNPLGDLDIGAWMIPIEWDSRDHEQFPRSGWKVDGRAMFYSDSAGSEFNAETYKIAGNYYLPMRERDVLATRLMVRWTKGDAPFFLKSSFGGATDLRGYTSGRFRDNMMYAVQTEYRWQFNNKWIFTGFVGVGEVAERFSDFGEYYLPAAGVGARFVLSQKHKVSLSFDVARGKTGTEYYVGVGEAF